MRIGVMGPGAFEITPFIEQMDAIESVTLGGRIYNTGKIGTIDTVAVESGICKVNTAAVAQRLISDFLVDVLAVIGVAGGMNPTLKVFDVVIPDRFAHHDVEPVFVKDYFPNTSDGFFYAHDDFIAACRSHFGDRVHFGCAVTGEAFIDQAGRESINAAYSPMTVDMETAAAAQVAHVNGVPFIAVRTVSDTEDNSGFGTFEDNCERAGRISADTLIEALRLDIKW